MHQVLKSLPLAALTIILLSACSGKPNVGTMERKWEVDPETGDYMEKEVRTITIYSSEDKDLPDLELPKKKK